MVRSWRIPDPGFRRLCHCRCTRTTTDGDARVDLPLGLKEGLGDRRWLEYSSRTLDRRNCFGGALDADGLDITDVEDAFPKRPAPMTFTWATETLATTIVAAYRCLTTSGSGAIYGFTL